MYIGPSEDFMFHLISGESAKLHPHPQPPQTVNNLLE